MPAAEADGNNDQARCVLTDYILINGVLFGLVLAAPVGPVGVLCVQRTLSEGRMHGLLSGLGAAIGDALYGAVAAFGVSAIEVWIEDHQASLRTVGGIVLLLLAARTIAMRSRPNRPRPSASTIHTESLVQDFISTFLLAVTNPITLLTFAGLFATLGMTDAGKSVGNAAILVLGVFLGSALWWLALSMTAGMFRNVLENGYQRSVTMLSALILAAFGIYALITAQFY